MRLLLYGFISIFAFLIILDVNLGKPVNSQKLEQINNCLEYISAKKLNNESLLLTDLFDNNGFRESSFLAYLFKATKAQDISYYAYTPVFSRHRIFLGNNFFRAGIIGKSSIIIHESAHIERHRLRALRGIPRGDDESEAYIKQYKTYKAIGLDKDGADGVVYWDMMIGIKTYVIPRHPEYAKKEDIISSLKLIDNK